MLSHSGHAPSDVEIVAFSFYVSHLHHHRLPVLTLCPAHNWHRSTINPDINAMSSLPTTSHASHATLATMRLSLESTARQQTIRFTPERAPLTTIHRLGPATTRARYTSRFRAVGYIRAAPTPSQLSFRFRPCQSYGVSCRVITRTGVYVHARVEWGFPMQPGVPRPCIYGAGRVVSDRGERARCERVSGWGGPRGRSGVEGGRAGFLFYFPPFFFLP